MKAQVFLELVGVMLDVQQDYFKSRLQTDLVKAKELEKRVRAVVKEGRLEPDQIGERDLGEEVVQINLFEEMKLFEEAEDEEDHN